MTHQAVDTSYLSKQDELPGMKKVISVIDNQNGKQALLCCWSAVLDSVSSVVFFCGVFKCSFLAETQAT